MTKTTNAKRFAAVLAAASLFALGACGKSDDASQNATADTVEMPADELPAVEPSAAALPPAPAADASQAALSVQDAAKSDANNAAVAAAEAKAALVDAQEPKPQ